MLTTNSILSRDQGKMFPKPKNENDFYARYATAADKAKPTVQQKTHAEGLLSFVLGWLLTHARPSEF